MVHPSVSATGSLWMAVCGWRACTVTVTVRTRGRERKYIRYPAYSRRAVQAGVDVAPTVHGVRGKSTLAIRCHWRPCIDLSLPLSVSLDRRRYWEHGTY
ncbi:hypothetical protein F4861DRAFT_115384 [Xylaria intraflava]|nr:hypothetical protein F4861DRAFT_115384 [Xylaria intraflava]